MGERNRHKFRKVMWIREPSKPAILAMITNKEENQELTHKCEEGGNDH